MMSYRILQIDVDPWAAEATERLLEDAGYRAGSAATFEEATQQVALECPDLLITSLRLGEFNGIHLMLRLRADYPDLPVIVTAEKADFALTEDVTRYGGRFLMRPVQPEQLLGLVSEMLAGRTARDPISTRRWPRQAAKLPATVSRCLGRIVDLSYEGMRIEFDGSREELAEAIQVDLPTLGFSIQAVPRWTRISEHANLWWCGAELAPGDCRTTLTWRGVVNSLN